MDFDPLLLFTAPEQKSTDEDFQLNLSSSVDQSLQKDPVSDNESELDTSDLTPLHVHDLPLLQLQPPGYVLQLFLLMLAPGTVRNFAPLTSGDDQKLPEQIFKEKKVSDLVQPSLIWIRPLSSRFQSEVDLSDISRLSESLKYNFPSEYNAYLTRLISSELQWLSEDEAEQIKKLASLRLAENCGRTAQPEFVREIEIPQIEKHILLKEPSLTADNLGLKTWGSSFVLGTRIANHKTYLEGSVLELGAGTGLVGMVACVLGYETMLTDLDEILPNLKENIELNGIKNARADELDWSDPSGFIERNGNLQYDTVILSDPLYSSKHPVWIVNMMNQFLSTSKNARVLLQLPIRKSFEKERETLWKLIAENGYKAEEEHFENGYDDFGETTFCFKKLVRDT